MLLLTSSTTPEPLLVFHVIILILQTLYGMGMTGALSRHLISCILIRGLWIRCESGSCLVFSQYLVCMYIYVGHVILATSLSILILCHAIRRQDRSGDLVGPLIHVFMPVLYSAGSLRFSFSGD